MSVAQWAPWVSVFLGGCLSGAALLSLSSDPPIDTRGAVTVPPGEDAAAPAEPTEQTQAPELQTQAADGAAEHSMAPSETAVAEPADPEAGPSAADILAALEAAYQRQVADARAIREAEASEAADAAATPEVDAVTAPVEAAPVEAAPASSPVAEQAVQLVAAADALPSDSPPEVEVDEGANAPREVAVAARAELDQAPIQQIAVLYQPVYVLPPGTNPAEQTTTLAPRAIGRDPWAPLSISPRHNPWAAVGVSSGVWAAGNVAGGVWAAGFTAGP